MTFTAPENISIVVNLVDHANDTGWSVDGFQATHVSCNSGFLTLTAYPVKSGHTYTITYTIVSGGGVQAFVGGTAGISHLSPDVIVETITAGADGFVQLFSGTNVTLQLFNIEDVTINDGVTVVYSIINKKWSHFWSAQPDFGVSLFESNITMYQGNVWFQLNGSSNTNSWYGVSYQSIVQAVFAKNPGTVKTFEALSYQATALLVSTINGITTPLGQVTTLIDTDFIKQKLEANGMTVISYQTNNVYSASFFNDSNDDTLNGDPLKGNYILIEMTTVDGSTLMQLFSMNVRIARTFIGSR